MKLQVPFLQLPLLFDAAALANEVAAIGEDAWRPHPQGYPGNSMLPLVAVGGDPDNEAFAGPMAADAYLRALSVSHAGHVEHGRGARPQPPDAAVRPRRSQPHVDQVITGPSACACMCRS